MRKTYLQIKTGYSQFLYCCILEKFNVSWLNCKFMNKKALGKLGEEYAAVFLISQNYFILKHNYHSRFGEIDLIAVDSTKKELVFIEVKSRISKNFGTPAEAITRQKQNKILKTIFHFFSTSKSQKYSSWRIDLIGLELNRQLKLKNITHLRNILN